MKHKTIWGPRLLPELISPGQERRCSAEQSQLQQGINSTQRFHDIFSSNHRKWAQSQCTRPVLHHRMDNQLKITFWQSIEFKILSMKHAVKMILEPFNEVSKHLLVSKHDITWSVNKISPGRWNMIYVYVCDIYSARQWHAYTPTGVEYLRKISGGSFEHTEDCVDSTPITTTSGHYSRNLYTQHAIMQTS